MRISDANGRSPTRRGSRPGVLSIELLLVLPVLLFLALVFVQMSLMIAATQRLTAASYQGARIGSRGGARADVEVAIQDMLGPAMSPHMQVDARLTDPRTGHPVFSGAPVEVVIRVPVRNAVPGPALVYRPGDQLVGRAILRKE